MAPSITAFFPAYNDAGTIASMVVVADLTLRKLTNDYEIIVVNDGSPDHCGEILADLQTRYDRLRVVTHEQNRGYGGALRSGFANATKELVFYTDGDAQYDPRELAALFGAFSDRVDMVNGYKIHRNDPVNRKLIGKVYHHTVAFMFRLKLRDVDCDFRLLRRSIFDVVHLEANSGIICVELMKKIQDAGFRIAEVPVHHFHRAYGISQFFNLRRVWRTGLDLIHLWYRLVWKGESRPAPVGAAASSSTVAPAPTPERAIGGAHSES